MVLAVASSGCASSAPAGGAEAAGNPAGAGRAVAGDLPAFRRVVRPFPVFDARGDPYDLPFLGGFDVPRPQFVDMDGDGDLDLFVQERTDELVFLENVGSREAAAWEWRTDRFQDLEIGEWSRFADLDGDGDLDLLAEERFSHIRWFRNEGSATDPRFVLAVDTVRDVGGDPVFSDRQNIPQVADIDCDGVPDLFLGRVDGTVARYEMVPGSAASGDPRFDLVDDRFEDIEIVARIGQPSLHGANSMGFADVDGDGDQDFFWGDFFEPGVLFIRNGGDCSVIDLRDEPRPVATVSGETLATSGYNAPVPVDIDGDGDVDLALGVLGGAFNPNLTATDNFHLWERVEDGRLRRVTGRYLDGIDVGSESVPALGDLDGDGDLDLLVANKIDPVGLRASRVYRFDNRGTSRAPEYHLVDTLTLGDAYHYAPVLADLDGDGDLDLVVGTWNDDVLLYRNAGSASEPRFAATAEVLVALTRGSNATPTLGDVDGDGDLDLMVGEASGTINFYLNRGTPREPRFELVSDEYGGMDVGRRSHPVLVDLDGDGLLDLVVGREEAGVAFFRNVGGGGNPRFLEEPLDLPLHPYGAPAFADVDGDGDLDVVAGTLGGGLVFLEGTGRATPAGGGRP